MKYPKPVCDYIAAHASECSMREMAERVNRAFGTAFTEEKIKSFLRNHGLRNGRPNGVPHGYSKLFSKEAQSYILGNYQGVSPREMAQRVNERFGTAYDVYQMRNFYARRKLRSGISARWKLNNTPWNKGLAGYSAPGTEGTRFQPGSLPPQTLPVGSETETKDGYLQVKVAMPNVWKLKHRLVWEQARGPIPKNHIVVFKDRNKKNCAPDNLMLVSRSQLAIMNHENLWRESAEANESAALVAELKHQLIRRAKK